MTWLQDGFASSCWQESHPATIEVIRKRKVEERELRDLLGGEETRSISSRDKRKSNEEKWVLVDACITSVYSGKRYSTRRRRFFKGIVVTRGGKNSCIREAEKKHK